MKLAICDDEIVFRKQLIESIDKYYKNYSNLDIYEFSSGEELLESYDSGAVYDIVFLDIEMKDINGLDTAKIIRKYRRNEIIVFLTSHTKYAIDGYEVNALRFLEKPINIYNSSQIKNILYQNEVFLSIFGKIIISKVGGVVCRKN